MEIKKIAKNALRFINIKKCRRLGLAPNSIPFLFLWVTNRCNSHCQMCDQWKTNPKIFSGELSTEEWFSVIDSAAKMDTMLIAITGGEPLMRKDIFQILERINKRRISSHLRTNGTLLNEATTEKLMNSPPTSVSVSLDSHEAEIHNELRGKDCFNTTVRGIKLLKEKILKTKIGINYLICKKNFQNLSKIVPFAESLGVDKLNIQPIHTNLQHRHKSLESYNGLLFKTEDMPKLKDEIIKFNKAISKTKLKTLSKTFIDGIPNTINKTHSKFLCYSGYVSCAIDPFGVVSPCEDIEGTESIRDKPLEDIWKSLSFQELRNRVHNCFNCWDTTHTELNIRCSIRGLLQEFREIIKDVDYYLK